MKKLVLAFLFFSLSVNAAVLHLGGNTVPLGTAKTTSPALAINLSGTTYYAALDSCGADNASGIKINFGGNTYAIASGNWSLITEISVINSCGSQVLQPGRYMVQIRGGTGGNGGSGGGGTGSSGLDATAGEYEFCLTQETTAYAFRGGNGNNGTNGQTGGNAGSGGAPGSGGASGAPTMVAVGDNVYKSNGGGGGRGGPAKDYQDNVRNNGAGGGGGIDNPMTDGLSGKNGYVALGASYHMIGGGGGGAPNGEGGASDLGNIYGAGAGSPGAVDAGGSGGYAKRMTSTENGGNGGLSVSWVCGGEQLYSYGGGGAGAINLRTGTQFDQVGVAGGSGSTGSSMTSYIRIYKLN